MYAVTPRYGGKASETTPIVKINQEAAMDKKNIILEIRKAFGSRCQDMFKIDWNMTSVCGRPVFDICRLEDWCSAEGMGDGESMEDFLTRKFGERRVALIVKALGLDD